MDRPSLLGVYSLSMVEVTMEEVPGFHDQQRKDTIFFQTIMPDGPPSSGNAWDGRFIKQEVSSQ